ncbi:MAG: hypothetical protein IJV43_09750, partial [Oscillospiraceae bacterium]|nr:hypothetical protein [Oscillospiraceae bacterium]
AFDPADPRTARALLSGLTGRQAACLYLYYGAGLTLRECAELLGVGHTAVLRTVQRALRAIRSTLRCGEFTLDAAALAGLAHELYAGAETPDGLPPETKKEARARLLQEITKRRGEKK